MARWASLPVSFFFELFPLVFLLLFFFPITPPFLLTCAIGHVNFKWFFLFSPFLASLTLFRVLVYTIYLYQLARHPRLSLIPFCLPT